MSMSNMVFFRMLIWHGSVVKSLNRHSWGALYGACLGTTRLHCLIPTRFASISGTILNRLHLFPYRVWDQPFLYHQGTVSVYSVLRVLRII